LLRPDPLLTFLIGDAGSLISPQTFSSSTSEIEGIAPFQFHRRVRYLLAIFFVSGMFFLLVGTIFHWDPIASSENRAMARAPEVPQNFKTALQWSEDFLAYFRDHFAFRNTLIRALSLATFHSGLEVDKNANIIIGKDGWLS
jgi:hypothetical protein